MLDNSLLTVCVCVVRIVLASFAILKALLPTYVCPYDVVPLHVCVCKVPLCLPSLVELNSAEQVKMAASFKTM